MHIYAIVNSVNGKIYIGQTVHDVKSRFEAHVRNAKYHNNMPICRAILKHGSDKFSYATLGKFDSIKAMNDAEIWWIKVTHATDPQYGYNLAGGGKGYGKRSAEQRERMSKLRKGKPVTEAQMKGLRAGWERKYIPKTIWTPERRAISSKTIKEIIQRPEFGLRVSLGKKGKPLHPNALSNLRKGPGSSKGFKFTPEQIERLRQAHIGQGKGRVLSQETKEKIRQARLEYWKSRRGAT